MRDGYPHVTVAAVIEHHGRFLLVEENDAGQRVFNQPAGHWELGESLIQAVIREVSEETRLLFQPEAILGIYQHTSPRNGITYLRVAFRGSHQDAPDNPPRDPDILAVHWWSLEEIEARREHLRSPLVWRALEDYQAGLAYPLELLRVL